MMSLEKKEENALRKKRPFGYTCFINSLIGASFVILHRPLPVIRSLRPSRLIFSNTNTLPPNSAARPAANNPAGPAPITITSKLFITQRYWLKCKTKWLLYFSFSLMLNYKFSFQFVVLLLFLLLLLGLT